MIHSAFSVVSGLRVGSVLSWFRTLSRPLKTLKYRYVIFYWWNALSWLYSHLECPCYKSCAGKDRRRGFKNDERHSIFIFFQKTMLIIRMQDKIHFIRLDLLTNLLCTLLYFQHFRPKCRALFHLPPVDQNWLYLHQLFWTPSSLNNPLFPKCIIGSWPLFIPIHLVVHDYTLQRPWSRIWEWLTMIRRKGFVLLSKLSLEKH